MSESNVPNPFESARRIVGINVTLAPHDITEIWHSLTEEQVARLFDRHGSSIAVQMLAAGTQAVIQIIEQEGTPS